MLATSASHLDRSYVLDQSSRARTRAAELGQMASAAIASARATRSAIVGHRLHSRERRRLHVGCGGSDGKPEETMTETQVRACPRCASVDVVGLGTGQVTSSGLFRADFLCRCCENRFVYVRSDPRFDDARTRRCRHVTISTGVGRRCDGCSDAIEPQHMEFQARFADGGTLRYHSRCFSRWYNDTQR